MIAKAEVFWDKAGKFALEYSADTPYLLVCAGGPVPAEHEDAVKALEGPAVAETKHVKSPKETK